MKRLLLVVVLGALTMTSAFGDVIYDSNPSVLPPNMVSQPYEAVSSWQFGDLIQFAPGTRDLSSVVVTMSNWATESTYEAVGTSAGFTVPLTLNLYNVGAGNTVGSVIATDTINAFIPWRPESGGCADTTAYLASDGNCYHGLVAQVTFDFTGVTVPDSIIYGLALNTQDYGNPPVGAPGPYNSLNFALSSVPPTVGSNPLPDTAYWETSYAPFYADGGAGGVGTFRQDTGWTPYTGAITFNSVPEPGSLIQLAAGLLACGLLVRRKIANRA